jgi:phage shock protein A
MALINRVARLFKADAHAVIDQLEEPDLLLQQALREMQVIARESEDRLASLSQRSAALRKAIDDTERDVASCGDELDVCFAADDDDLARTVLRKRLQFERHVTALEQELDAVGDDLAAQESVLRDQQLACEELEQKARIIARPEARANAPVTGTVTADDVEIAFLAEKQRRAGV